jgi:hypothetical protein
MNTCENRAVALIILFSLCPVDCFQCLYIIKEREKNVRIFLIVEDGMIKPLQKEMEMKNVFCLVLVVLMLLFADTIPGYAVDGRGSHGGGSHGGGSHGGHYYHGGGSHSGHHYHSGSSWHGAIWIGPGWGGWDPWWGPPYYPHYYPYYRNYPYYPETPAVIQQQPPVYVQPKEQYYWYFCQNPEGYYPYIKNCPGGWLKVVPPTPPGEKE